MIGKSSGQRARLAETVSAELDRKLHRIDLGALDGRYTGETEKNLGKLFDAAETGGAILFFDEADALFGQRTTVKDAHDRYASQSVNFLLDRIERTRSVVIFATARARNIDPAFLRRLRFAIKLVAPAKTHRSARSARTLAKPRSRRTG